MFLSGVLGLRTGIDFGGRLLGFPPGSSTMSLTLLDDADPIQTLDALGYTATVTNTGLVPISTLSLAITLAGSLTYVGASAGTFSSISQSGGVVTATLSGTLAPGGTATCTISVTTGASAVSASTSGSATAANAATANATQVTDVQLVSKDSTNGWRFPANATEWTSNRTIKSTFPGGNPFLCWGLQESSGNVADSIGTFTGAKIGSPTFQSTEPSTTRKGVLLANDGTAFFWNQDAGLPATSTASSMVITFCDYLTQPSGNRELMLMPFTAPRGTMQAVANSDIEAASFAGTTVNGAASVRNSLHVNALKFDRTNLINCGYSDQEVISVGFQTAIVSKGLAIGSGLTPACRHVYTVGFRDGAAEVTDAQFRAGMQGLGITMAW